MATEDHNLLTDVATSIGSALGNVAAKVESIRKDAPSRDEIETKVRRAGAAAERRAKSVSRVAAGTA